MNLTKEQWKMLIALGGHFIHDDPTGDVSTNYFKIGRKFVESLPDEEVESEEVKVDIGGMSLGAYTLGEYVTVSYVTDTSRKLVSSWSCADQDPNTNAIISQLNDGMWVRML